MTKQDFRPVYATGRADVRLCYDMNGKWRIQVHSGREATREYDPWETMSPRLDYEEGLEVLGGYARGVVAPSVAPAE